MFSKNREIEWKLINYKKKVEVPEPQKSQQLTKNQRKTLLKTPISPSLSVNLCKPPMCFI
jgi:hypothetical protein